jgi:hypothetical protein
MMRLTSPARHSRPGMTRPGTPDPHGHRGDRTPPRAPRRRRFTVGRRAGVLLSVLGVAVGCALLSAGAAFAYWEITASSDSGAAVAGRLSAPTGGATTGPATPSALPISWTAPTGYTPTGYTVLRCAGSSCTPTTPVAGGGCSGLVTATNCTDNDPALAAGTTYTYAVTAALDNWVSPASAPFPATTTGAAQLTFTAQPDVNAKIPVKTGSFNVSVAIQDSTGTTLANDNHDTVTLALKGAGKANLSCANSGGLTRTVSSGVASFTGCTVDLAVNNVKLTATSSVTPALTGPANANSFDVVAGAATQLVFTTPAVSGPISPSANLGPVTVTEEDASGNPTNAGKGGVTVSLAANPSSGAVFSDSSGGTPLTTVTIPAGQSTATFYVGDSNAGSLGVTASATGLTSVSQTETIEAVQLKITSNAVSGAASASPTIGPIRVQLQTTDGNATTLTTATTVTLASDSKGVNEFADANGTLTSTITIPAGKSSATFSYGDQVAGRPTLTVTASGGLSDTQKVTVTPAAAAGLVFSNVTVGNANKSSNSTAGCTVSITSCTASPEAPGGTGRFLTAAVGLVDQFGNTIKPTSDTTVTLTQTGGTAVTSPVTIASGSSASGTFTESLADAGSKTTVTQGTVTATATVGGASLSAALTS